MRNRWSWVRQPQQALVAVTVGALVAAMTAIMPVPARPNVGADGVAVGASPSAPGASLPNGGSTAGRGTRANPANPPSLTTEGLPESPNRVGDTPSSGAGESGPSTESAVGSTPPPTTDSSVASGDFAASYQGVTADAVLWGFSAQAQPCGGFDQTAIASAYGSEQDPIEDYKLAKEYFNEYPLVDFPLPPEIRENVNAENGYWGRRIDSVFRDSGGNFCQDKGRANAVKMAEEDKVFGLIQAGNEGPEVPMSLVMAQHDLVHIGRLDTWPSYFQERAPYQWDGFWGTGREQVIAQGSWVCRDWAGEPASDTGDPLVAGQARKFGILLADNPGFKELADILEEEIARCGVTADRYEYIQDLTVLESTSQTAMNRMRQDGVTTILHLADFFSTLFLTRAATNQNYHPEWIRSGWAMGALPRGYRTFMTEDQAVNTWSAADAASIVNPPYHESESYVAFKRIRPNQEPTDSWNVYYHQFKLLAIGMAGAGRNLTPETFGDGLARLCTPCPRADPLLPLNIVYKGHYANREGFTLVRWNPSKPDPTSPPNPDGSPQSGYFDFIEDGKRYGLRITDPDPGI